MRRNPFGRRNGQGHARAATRRGTLGQVGLGRLVLRQGLPILGVLALLPLLAGWLQGLDFAAGWAALSDLPGSRWVGAPCMTAVSFRALGRYDQAIHRWLAAGLALFASLDCAAAALAFWLLLPPDAGLPFLALLPAFLLALGAGIIGGTPGGAGPFEAALVLLLAQGDGAALSCAILGFRLVYYALPAGMGLLWRRRWGQCAPWPPCNRSASRDQATAPLSAAPGSRPRPI